jgi:hypothetical protein
LVFGSRKTYQRHRLLALNEHRQQQQVHRTTRRSRELLFLPSLHQRPFVASLLRVNSGRHNVLPLTRRAAHTFQQRDAQRRA